MSKTQQPAEHNKSFTNEEDNITTSADITSDSFDTSLLEYSVEGDFWGLLENSPSSLMVSREYEHFVVGLDGKNGSSWQSAMPMPHPSGLFYDADNRELVFSSTRTPNIILWYKLAGDKDTDNGICPESLPETEGSLFLPKKSVYLPGSLYIHDLVKQNNKYYATVTGHNFLAEIREDGGWKKIWSPRIVDSVAENSRHRTNFLQLNSVGFDSKGIENGYCTAFSDLVTGAKPWKEGYGPKEKGVIFSVATGEVIVRNLTCPHSAKLRDDKLWVCNSGYGEVGYIENFRSHDSEQTRFVPVFKAPGFTRGLAFIGDYVFVGLSKVIDKYEPYAPGIKPSESKCGIWVFNYKTGEFVASLDWHNGYQIYDIQALTDIRQPRLPLAQGEDGINYILRYLG